MFRNVFYFGLSLTNQTLSSCLESEEDKFHFFASYFLFRPIMWLEAGICERVIGEHKPGQQYYTVVNTVWTGRCRNTKKFKMTFPVGQSDCSNPSSQGVGAVIRWSLCEGEVFLKLKSQDVSQ